MVKKKVCVIAKQFLAVIFHLRNIGTTETKLGAKQNM